MLRTKQTFSISATAEDLVPDRLGRMSYGIALILIFFSSLIITFLLPRLPLVVPLFFTLPWGEVRLVPRLFIYLLPVIGLLVIIFNLGLGRIAAKLSPLLPRVLAVSSAVVCGMLLIALLGIIQSLVL